MQIKLFLIDNSGGVFLQPTCSQVHKWSVYFSLSAIKVIWPFGNAFPVMLVMHYIYLEIYNYITLGCSTDIVYYRRCWSIFFLFLWHRNLDLRTLRYAPTPRNVIRNYCGALFAAILSIASFYFMYTDLKIFVCGEFQNSTSTL